MWPVSHDAVITTDERNFHYVLSLEDETDASKTFLSIKTGADRVYTIDEFLYENRSSNGDDNKWIRTLLNEGIKRLTGADVYL